MKKIILIAALIVAVAFGASADTYTIKRDKLPAAAREMLDTYFPKKKVSMIKVDRHLLRKTDYDVKLTDGTKIEFNNAGKWTSVDCKTRKVPDGLIPKTIRNYIAKNFPEPFITEIEKKSSGYEVELSDDIKLKFNLLGTFVKVLEDD